ncbi:YhdP family protein [Nitrosomonas sp.]|uniref:YhdP family protein n=1 Tax=Nitrosomonas sp. TaxID=42353 RepID=UPI0025D3C2DB|nr:YhdP family protein [Nitrosomonas sp.]MCC6917524.1 TIGR02099 family protein [Nitrosomonas sp.]
MPHSFLRLCAIGLSRAGRGLLLGLMLAGLLLLAMRYWILPDIGRYRSDIAAAVTDVAGQPVQIDAIKADWDGLRPHLSMQGVSVSDRLGNPVLVFPEIEGTVSWRSLLRGELNFHEIVIDRPALVTRRDTEGIWHIAGVALSENRQESGFLDWLLRQRRLIVKQATVYWQDELHQRPVHYFESVSLYLQNTRWGKRHQFGLQAGSSSPLFSRAEIRGDFVTDAIRALSGWQGRLFVELRDFDLESWQKWMILPAELSLKKGKGSMRAWTDIHAGSFTRWVSDISLQNATIQFARHLPAMELSWLSGRGGWQRGDEVKEVVKGKVKGIDQQWFSRDLKIGFNGLPLTALTNISLHVLDRKDPTLSEYSLQAEGLDMSVLTRLAASLPVKDGLHKLLSGLSARGTVKHVNLKWQGDWTQKSPFRINAGFSDIAVRSLDDYPAFSGLSGVIDASETGGSLFLSSKNAAISKPRQQEEKLRFDTLTGRLDWKTAADHEATRIKFSNIAFKNDAGSGSLQGSYIFGKDVPAQVDLAGSVSQGDLQLLERNITWVAGNAWKSRLSGAAVSGQVSDAKFHIRGPLHGEFTGKNHDFSINAEAAIHNAEIRIPGDWPEISGVTGRVSKQEGEVNLSFSAASVAGIGLQKFTLQTDDWHADRPEIRIRGVAEGESAEMAALLSRMAVDQHVNELLKRTGFSGKGQLQADVVLSAAREKFSVTRLQGRYQFKDNRIDFDRYVPDFDKVNGSLIFSESGVVLEDMHARLLGGPVDIFSSPLPEGGIRISARGRADFERFRSEDSPVKSIQLSQLWTQFAHGASDWQVAVDVERNKVGIVIESSLEGVELTFPAPFSKPAARAVPMRLEKIFTSPHDDFLRFHYGDSLTAEFQRIHEKTHFYHPVRGIIRFGGHGTLPQDKITRIEGSIPRLQWDQLRTLFKWHAGMDVSLDHDARGLDNILTRSLQFDLKIDQAEFLSSIFNDVALSGERAGETWRVHVSGQEADGKIIWHTAEPQKVVARLNRLKIPENAPINTFISQTQESPGDWPALDIEADELFAKEGRLGQLKLSAVQRKDGWLVENLDIRHPDSRLLANGLWENHVPPYRMYSHIRLQSGNIGKLLKRHGYPGRIARGEGVLEGDLNWAGKPSSPDLPTLSGSLQLDAQHGQFTELKPGIARLLGIFDLKSLPRRLMLDFYDVFGKGFGFDELSGLINIRNGIASVDNLYISGSAAELALSGKLDLVNETQALNLKVFPSLGLATPIAGIAAMIASRTLRDPFDRVLLNEYEITGSWSDPVVARLNEESGGAGRPQGLPH